MSAEPNRQDDSWIDLYKKNQGSGNQRIPGFDSNLVANSRRNKAFPDAKAITMNARSPVAYLRDFVHRARKQARLIPTGMGGRGYQPGPGWVTILVVNPDVPGFFNRYPQVQLDID